MNSLRREEGDGKKFTTHCRNYLSLQGTLMSAMQTTAIYNTSFRLEYNNAFSCHVSAVYAHQHSGNLDFSPMGVSHADRPQIYISDQLLQVNVAQGTTEQVVRMDRLYSFALSLFSVNFVMLHLFH